MGLLDRFSLNSKAGISRGFVEQHFFFGFSDSLESNSKDSFALPLALLFRSFAWSALPACREVKDDSCELVK